MTQGKENRTRSGVVVSRSGDKSIRVVIDYLVKHPKYGKYLKRSTKLAVHDEKNIAGVGDTVEIVQCRPMSKFKSWRVVEVLKKVDVE